MVYVVQNYLAYFGLYPSILHTRRWIESKVSPIILSWRNQTLKLELFDRAVSPIGKNLLYAQTNVNTA
jgi:hypothetical protein